MKRILLGTCALVLLLAADSKAQEGLQLWGNVTFGRVMSHRVTYDLDLEPKVLVDVPPGQPGWWNLDLTPDITVVAAPWVDLTGELVAGYTQQNDDVGSWEVTPRIGVDIHLLSRLLGKREHLPTHRLALSNYFRVEWRNFFYTDEEPNSSTWRFRNRLGCTFAINRQRHTDDGAVYAITDFEWFLPLSDPAERFSNRQRFRAGVGYRHSFNWRLEALYMWTRSRDTIEDRFKRTESMIDIRVKWIF